MTPMQKAVNDAATGADVERVLAYIGDVLARFCGEVEPVPTVKLQKAWGDADVATKTLSCYHLYRVDDPRDGSGFRYLTRMVGRDKEVIVRYDTAVDYPGGKRVRYRTAIIRENGKVTRLDTYAQDPNGKWVRCHTTDEMPKKVTQGTGPMRPRSLKKTPKRVVRR
jgi:hypothetical protein